jgi:hypothetical protein
MKFWFLQCFFILAYLILLLFNFVKTFVNLENSNNPKNTLKYNFEDKNFTILLTGNETYLKKDGDGENKFNLTNSDEKQNQKNFNLTLKDETNLCIFFYFRRNNFPIFKKNFLPLISVTNFNTFTLEFNEKYFPLSDKVEYSSLYNLDEIGEIFLDSFSSINRWIFQSVCLTQEEIKYFSVLIHDDKLRSYDENKIYQMTSKKDFSNLNDIIIEYNVGVDYEIAKLGYINEEFLFDQENFEKFKFSIFPDKIIENSQSFELLEFNYFDGEKKFTLEMNKIFDEFTPTTHFNYYTLSFWIFPLDRKIQEILRFSILENLDDKNFYQYQEKNFIFYIKDGIYYISYYNIKERKFYKNVEISKFNPEWNFFILSIDAENNKMIIFQFDSCRKIKKFLSVDDIYLPSINYQSKLHIGGEENFKGYLFDFKINTEKIIISNFFENKNNNFSENLCDEKFNFMQDKAVKDCNKCESPVMQKYCPSSNSNSNYDKVKILYEDKKCLGK